MSTRRGSLSIVLALLGACRGSEPDPGTDGDDTSTTSGDGEGDGTTGDGDGDGTTGDGDGDGTTGDGDGDGTTGDGDGDGDGDGTTGDGDGDGDGDGACATWTRQLGTPSSECANGIAVDSATNIHVTGYTAGGLDGNTSAGANDVFVTMYDSAGTKQWTQQLGTPLPDAATGIALDSAANFHVAGWTAGGLDGNTSAGADDIFFARLSCE
jgi:hypothetical protein